MICKHNSYVRCDGADCGRCGWNPDVAAKRINKATGTVEVYDETTQKVVGRMLWPVLGCDSDKYF